MSDTPHADFSKFVPDFDFLQGLARGRAHGMQQMPAAATWMAPTLDPDELDKRIGELKAVQFWLDQNAVALKATIQALEVQKMTLATLKGMNLSMGDMAEAFKPKAASGAATAAKTARKSATAGAGAAGSIDPVQLWGALTQQFQQIAAAAMKEASPAGAVSASQPKARAPARKAGAASRARSR